MGISKREFLAGSVGLGAGLLGSAEVVAAPATTSAPRPAPERAAGAPPLGLEDVKVIVFDTFGSVVDWRGTYVRYLTEWGNKEGIKADWGKFIDDWRNGYYGAEMNWVRTGELPWTNLEDLFAMTLELVIRTQPGLEHLTMEQKHYINRGWFQLDPWPDSVAGLTRLKSRYVIGPLSNGSVPMLTFMAKHAKLPWDNIFATELFKHYKGDKETYLGVVELMRLQPGEVMMAAAHNWDLRNAQKLGLKTAFWPRPHEHGPGQTTDLAVYPGLHFDIVATDIEDFARQMGL